MSHRNLLTIDCVMNFQSWCRIRETPCTQDAQRVQLPGQCTYKLVQSVHNGDNSRSVFHAEIESGVRFELNGLLSTNFIHIMNQHRMRDMEPKCPCNTCLHQIYPQYPKVIRILGQLFMPNSNPMSDLHKTRAPWLQVIQIPPISTGTFLQYVVSFQTKD